MASVQAVPWGFPIGGRRGGSTPAEGRTDSVPEAGGTGAEAVGTPTAPPPVTTQTRPTRRALMSGVGRRTSGGWPPGTRRQTEAGELRNRKRSRSGGFPGGSKGGGAPLARARMFYIACVGLSPLAVSDKPVGDGFASGRQPAANAAVAHP